MTENATKLCRLCMYEEKCDDDSNKVFSVFDCETNTIHEKIRQCVGLNLKQDDIIPPNVCQNCIDFLEQFYIFFLKSQKTNEILKSIFNIKETNTETPQDISTNHLSNEGITYVPISDYDLIYKNQTYITNIDYFSESTSTPPNKINNNDINIGASTSKFKDNISEDFNDYSDTDSSSLITTKKHENVDKTRNLEQFFSCTKCNEVFSERKKLLQHSTKHKVLCDLCNVKILPEDLAAHSRKHLNRQNCFVCGARRSSQLEEHLPVSTTSTRNTKIFVCQDCVKRKNCQSPKKHHMTYRTTVNPYRCRYCNFSAKTISSLKAHTSRKHSMCEVCAKWFKSEVTLKQHEKRMHDIKKYICNICRKAFVQRNNLKMHIIKNHAKQKAYDCQICGREFCKVKQLKEHMHTHREYLKRPNRCKELIEKQLDRHMLTCVPRAREKHYNAVGWDRHSTISLPNSKVRD